jgi:hypothetical protein
MLEIEPDDQDLKYIWLFVLHGAREGKQDISTAQNDSKVCYTNQYILVLLCLLS